MDKRYEKVIDMPHHTSDKHKRMPMSGRAAQFSPFAALVGYEDAVKETARLTSERVELDESALMELDRRYGILKEAVDARISITYFKRDDNKPGGEYITSEGLFAGIDDQKRLMFLRNTAPIPVDDILAIEGSIFDCMDIN